MDAFFVFLFILLFTFTAAQTKTFKIVYFLTTNFNELLLLINNIFTAILYKRGGICLYRYVAFYFIVSRLPTYQTDFIEVLHNAG